MANNSKKMAGFFSGGYFLGLGSPVAGIDTFEN